MARVKYQTDEERMEAITAYRKRYCAQNSEVAKKRSQEWRAARGQTSTRGRPRVNNDPIIELRVLFKAH